MKKNSFVKLFENMTIKSELILGNYCGKKYQISEDLSDFLKIRQWYPGIRLAEPNEGAAFYLFTHYQGYNLVLISRWSYESHMFRLHKPVSDWLETLPHRISGLNM